MCLGFSTQYIISWFIGICCVYLFYGPLSSMLRACLAFRPHLFYVVWVSLVSNQKLSILMICKLKINLKYAIALPIVSIHTLNVMIYVNSIVSITHRNFWVFDWNVNVLSSDLIFGQKKGELRTGSPECV